MGSNPVTLAEDLCCPVCKKPLSSPGTPPKPKLHKIGRGKGRAPHLHSSIQAQRDTRMAIGKFKDNEEIVAAQCGHLFHKFCLRHYCYLVREGRSNHMYKVCCPCCDRHISMSSQTVDYRAHQDRPNDRDKEYTKTSIMNNELSGQMVTVQQKLQRTEASMEDARNNFEIYRSHWRKLRKELKNIKSKRIEIENLYSEIERSEQMLKCMQSQQLKIVRKFILKVKAKQPKEYIHFPRRLAPFIHLIEEEDRLVRDLGEIIVPIHLNHLKSDRQSLLKGIIATIHEKLAAQGKSVEIPTVITPEQQIQKRPDQPPKKPAIFVKVRKSSISILSSTSLTKESIQQIIETVDIPLHGKKAGKKKVRLAEKASGDLADNASTSDIKVLYMPKRKMAEQTSEPCRSIEESDSYAKVPARMCKSTDAVLIKTKKKTGTTCRSSKPKSKSNICERRSTATVVVSSKPRSDDAIHKEKGPENETEIQQLKAPKQVEKGQSNSIDKPASPHTPQSTLKSASKPSSPTEAPAETASLLKLIYDNLEEEQKSTHNLESHRHNTYWADFDENNNELLDDVTGNGIFSRSKRTSNESQAARPPPQFFRVDRRGIARPESPQTERFRQPSFLSSNSNNNDKSLETVWFCPDEENQLDSLTADEKRIIAMEKEAFVIARRHCGGSSIRRQMFHGTPACMGMPNGPCNFGLPPVPQHVPFYLKKWQQQLASRKVTKTMPKRFATSSMRSTGFVNAANCELSHSTNRRSAANPFLSSQQETDNFSVTGVIRLPPITMYPAKRPTTAQCDEALEGFHHREGPEKEVATIYDYDCAWK